MSPGLIFKKLLIHLNNCNMNEKFIQFENHSFNATYIASLKKEDFISENKGNQFKRQPDQESEKLGLVWDACTAAVKEPAIKDTAKTASKK